MNDEVNFCARTIDCARQGIHQKRHVVVDDFHDRVATQAPAVRFLARIEHSDLCGSGLPFASQSP